MPLSEKPIVVFGATGQQGRSVTRALTRAGWKVRAFVHNPETAELSTSETVRGDFSDKDTIRSALHDAYGAFLALPSSAEGTGISDSDEVRWGTEIADLAAESGIGHFVYTSSNGVGKGPTGIGHYEGKAQIERHIRDLPMRSTILRPAGFMETLMMPGSGFDEGRFSFFVRRDQSVQLIAVEDIGRFVATAFADPERFGGVTMEIAGDTLTGETIERALTQAAGRQIAYSRFAPDFLAAHPLLQKMTALFDAGPLAGSADLDALRKIVPGLTSFREWLDGSGREPFRKALGTDGRPS